MTRRQLPIEVLFRILDNVNDKTDLCSISLASRALRHEGQRALFRHPGILKIELPELAGNKFLDSVISSPHRLALTVRSFEAHLVWERRLKRQGCVVGDFTEFLQCNMSDQKNYENIIKFINKLERALVLMTNLKSLSVVASRNRDLPEAVQLLPRILRGCTFQLHELYWEHIFSDEELIMSEFLLQQPALRSLELPINQPQYRKQYIRILQFYTATGPPNLNLETLSGSADMTLLLLNRADGEPSRTKYLRWTTGFTRRSRRVVLKLPHLSDALSNIYLFHLDYNHIGNLTSRHDPIGIFLFLNNLHVLRFSMRNIKKITQEHLDTLARLSKLRVLVMVIESGLQIGEHDIAKTVVENMFSCCRNLEYIDVENLRANSSSERLTHYISKRHGAPKNEEYSWKNRHHFVQNYSNDA